jgi:hypothetical protein
MQLGDVRDALASRRLGMSPARLQALSARLFRDPELFALTGLEIDGSGQYGVATATPAACVLMVLAALIDAPVATEWHSAVMLHWHTHSTSSPVSTAPANTICRRLVRSPVNGCSAGC